jgi:hypothetical protein
VSDALPSDTPWINVVMAQKRSIGKRRECDANKLVIEHQGINVSETSIMIGVSKGHSEI